MRYYFMRDLPEFPPLELTDYLVKDLGVAMKLQEILYYSDLICTGYWRFKLKS